MAKNDYYVIVYYLLSYLYHCLKNGEQVGDNVVYLETYPVSIAEEYRDYVLINMYTESLISGIKYIEVPILGKGKVPAVKSVSGIKITPKGISYLQDNSSMNKAKQAVKDIGGVLSSMIQAFN